MKMKNKYEIISNFFNNIFYLKFVSINDKLILIKKIHYKIKISVNIFLKLPFKITFKKIKKSIKTLISLL